MTNSGDNGEPESGQHLPDGNGAPNYGPSKSHRLKSAEGRSTPAAKLAQFSSGLSEPFIKRPVMTTLLTVSIVVFGIITYRQLAVNDLPAVDYPIIQVNASYPGSNPETMAN